MRWKGHSEVHLEWNKCKTIEQGVQESWNICESKNKTIRNIWVQKGNPNREVRARVYRNSVWGCIQCLEFNVWRSELHVSSFGPVLCESYVSGQDYGM